MHGSLGNLSLYVLPLLRERVFPDEHARLKPAYNIDPGLSTYESSRGKRHVDFAARYAQTLGAWDVGVSQFVGTGREPLLLPVFTPGKPLLLAPGTTCSTATATTATSRSSSSILSNYFRYRRRTMMNDMVFDTPRPNGGAALRVLCFPFAGGSAVNYHPWLDHLEARAELVTVQMPARGARLNVRLLDSAGAAP